MLRPWVHAWPSGEYLTPMPVSLVSMIHQVEFSLYMLGSCVTRAPVRFQTAACALKAPSARQPAAAQFLAWESVIIIRLSLCLCGCSMMNPPSENGREPCCDSRGEASNEFFCGADTESRIGAGRLHQQRGHQILLGRAGAGLEIERGLDVRQMVQHQRGGL